MEYMEPNSLIKIDDLYWSDEENGYVALSSDEMEAVIMATMIDKDGNQKGDISIEDITNAVRWSTHVRVGGHLLNGVLSGRIKINMETGEPRFYEVKYGNELVKNDNPVE